MNTDQLKGKLQDAIGHIKQATGEATGNDRHRGVCHHTR